MVYKSESDAKAYWQENISLVIRLLVVWFILSFFCGLLLVGILNQIQLGDSKLGFWFAQQGSIFTFVILIFIYARKMSALDRK